MKLNLFRAKIKKSKFLVLDIGTEAVKALFISVQTLAEKKDSSKITILGAAIQYFEKYGVFNGRDFGVDIIKKAVLKVIEGAYKNFIIFSKEKKIGIKEKNIKKLPVLLGLPANILKARVAWQSFERKELKKKISEEEQDFIYQECLKEARKKISQRFAQKSGILPADIQWINQEIIEIKIDGYLVSELQEYKGKDIAIKILATFLPKYYLESIERVFKDLQLRIFKIVHIAENLHFIWGDKKIDSIFFDVGGEITQIFLVKGGSLYYIDEFDGGGKIFSLRLSDTLGIEEELAKDLKERYTRRSLSAGSAERIKEIFLQEKKIWYENLKIKIKEISQKILLPSSIYLFGGGSLLPEIREVLQENKIGNNVDLSISNLPDVKLIYPEKLKNIDDSAKRLKSPQYIPSLLVSYYGKKIF